MQNDAEPFCCRCKGTFVMRKARVAGTTLPLYDS